MKGKNEMNRISCLLLVIFILAGCAAPRSFDGVSCHLSMVKNGNAASCRELESYQIEIINDGNHSIFVETFNARSNLVFALEYRKNEFSSWSRHPLDGCHDLAIQEIPSRTHRTMMLYSPLRFVPNYHRLSFFVYFARPTIKDHVLARQVFVYPGDPDKTEAILCSP